MQAALLLEADKTVRPWELEALTLAVESGMEITTILHSINDQRPPLRLKHAAYHALASISRTGRSMRRKADIDSLLPGDVRVLSFESEWEDGQQSLPASVTDQLKDLDVVVKFGTHCLRNPESIPTTHGVISYRHGSSKMRKVSSAGFHELDQGEPVMDIVVQQRTDSREGGRILAKAHSRVVPTSHKATLNDAMALGIPLLAQALAALRSNDVSETTMLEPERNLPKNRHVVRTLTKMTRARVGRLFYGGFKEKRWNVAYVPGTYDPENTDAPHSDELQPIELPAGYTFAADPCAYYNGRLYVELMHAGRGTGEIFAYANGAWQPIDVPVGGGHLSYPQIIEHEGATYLFPEMADNGPPALFRFREEELTCDAPQYLVGLENERIVDGTMIEHNEHWYLFGSPLDTANERLDLWAADNPLGSWTLHPSSPICLDPRSARMGGPILHANDRLYRVGQDGSIDYGQAASISRIETLTPDDYKEVWLRPFAIEGAFGPHTVLATENGYWLDYYTEKTTPMAGIRRLRGLLQ